MAPADPSPTGTGVAEGPGGTDGAVDPRWKRVVLVGFMGSGKTTVGRILAERLGWSFLDLDALVEHWAGASVAEIFDRWGEGRFRDLERAVGRETLSLERVVLSPGGGWAAAPGRLEGLEPGTLTVWLEVSPEVALERARRDTAVRPLLEGPDALAEARLLLAEREAFYRAAALHVRTDDRPPDEVAEAVERAVRGRSPAAPAPSGARPPGPPPGSG